MDSSHYKILAFDKVCKVCINHLNNRKVAILGDSYELRKLMKDKYDIEINTILTSDAKNIEKYPQKYKLIDDLTNKSLEYYIIIPFLNYDDNIKRKLQNMGYMEYRDFIFRNHEAKVLGPEKIDYCDEYGNSIHTNGGIRVFLNERACGNNVNIVSYIADGKIYLSGENASIDVREKCLLTGSTFRMFSQSIIVIERNTSSGGAFRIDCHAGCNVYISEDCMFSSDVVIISGDGHSIFDVESGERKNSIYPHDNRNEIYLGKHVWVGYRSMILYNTNIGDSSIIGAGSIVKGKFPNNCILAGNPSKIIKKNITWSRNPYASNIEECGKNFINYTIDSFSER